ncbi:hypothetical protein BOTCAL_0002g00060 [Botryotinia calthae]|uniref:Uncharacterized protein n=1 Tax=Botryotinia calthae TaxID=38488 RepID=A0A4Y8DHS1_9HELO|nr:hypothetical protein BOTCAL_0002g00060 [Botryotinia calthae]
MGAIYDQHSLTLFKRDSFSLFKLDSFSFNGLDNLFALKSTPTGFFNVELLAHAKLVVPLALYFWLVAIVPPATLSVVLFISVESQPAKVPTSI